MGKLFYYTRKVVLKNQEGQEHIIDVQDCFNIDCVVRAVWASEVVFMVLLNDGHEESKNTFDTKGRPVKTRDWHVSQIELFGEDVKRFRSLTELV